MTTCDVCNNQINNATPNYKLPQWDGETVTSWLVQMNYAMLTIDTALHGLALRTSVGDIPEDVIKDVEKLNLFMSKSTILLGELCEEVTALKATSANQQTQLATLGSQVSTLNINYVNCDTRLSTLESAIEGLRMNVEKLTENLNSLTDRVAALEDK